MTSIFNFGSRDVANASPTRPSVEARLSRSTAATAAATAREIGALLRERREAMGVTLVEAEAATRIRQKYLSALEADEWHLLPGEVVGRGFLRNYSTYLGLEPTEIIERRRSIADVSLAGALANTSAGTLLPEARQVDYRPKDVDLRDDTESMERREVRRGPIVAWLLVLLMLLLLLWGGRTLFDWGRNAAAGIQAGMSGLVAEWAATPAPAASITAVVPIVNPQNTAADTGGEQAAAAPIQDAAGSAPSSPAEGAAAPTVEPALVLLPTLTPTPLPIDTPEAPPTPTPEPPLPTNTPEPLPTPTPEEPTPTPEPLVVAPVCPDARSLISSPGVNQVVNGVTSVTGTATHEAFQYYKLEFAPGANAGGGFVFFAGGRAPVIGGVLGSLDTLSLPNGEYTLQLVVVDQTGNFPPPCAVTITVQN